MNRRSFLSLLGCAVVAPAVLPAQETPQVSPPEPKPFAAYPGGTPMTREQWKMYMHGDIYGMSAERIRQIMLQRPRYRLRSIEDFGRHSL